MTSAGQLAGRTAIITGGNGGIGFAIAEAFVAEGARVAIVGTNEAKLAGAAERLTAAGSAVLGIRADVADPSACRSTVAEASDVLGAIDICVNGAGVYQSKRFLDYTADEYRRLMSVNVDGVFNMCQSVLPGMIERGHGRIINIASSAGKWASRNQAIYNMSKHAVVGLTRCLALEFGASGVTVNALCPGLVQTDMSDMLEQQQAAASGSTPADVRASMLGRIAVGRYLSPSECAPMAVLMAADTSSGMTGQSIMVDGGMIFV